MEDNREYTPIGRYDGLLYSVYLNKRLSRMLRLISHGIVAVCVAVFGVALALAFYNNLVVGVKLAAVTGIPFVLVTVLRKLIDAKRPYEVLPFYEEAPKSKRGQSFPSRHVFSCILIGTTLAFYNLVVGIALVCLGAALALIRVLLGIHFIRDVVTGALAGAVCGVLGMLTVLFI